MKNIIFKEHKELYLIGEIGINHNGDVDTAKKLIDAVNCCGWQSAKFQKRNPDVSVPKSQKNVLKKTIWGEMSYIDYKKKIEFNKREYDIINEYCSSKNIDWSCSVWDIDSLSFLLDYDVPWIKIPSAKLTETDLIVQTAQTKKPIIISTAMSTIEEIDCAVNNILKYNDNLLIMHSHASYPAPAYELNLNTIPFLAKRYDLPIGYSGHEDDLEPTIISFYLGANFIERHITLDHTMWGSDHSSSLEVHGMSLLKKRLQIIPKILGSFDKKIFESELLKRKQLRGY